MILQDIYNAGGTEVLIKLWNALKTNEKDLDDEEFVKLLDEKVHPVVGGVYRKWH
jgi:D-lyxose ketol-isomerase